MNILNLEDSLDEFDVRYMESYNQVINRPPPVLSSYENSPEISADFEGTNSISAQTKGLTLSSPLLEDKNFSIFPNQENLFDSRKQTKSMGFSEIPIYNDISPTHREETAMKPPIKPSVTVASVDTLMKFQRLKHFQRKSLSQPKSSSDNVSLRRRKTFSGSLSENRPSSLHKHLKIKNTSLIPFAPSFPLDSGISNQQKKRKVSFTPTDDAVFRYSLVDRDIASSSTMSSSESLMSLKKPNDDPFNSDKYWNEVIVDD